MAFTVKARVASLTEYGNQTKITFAANYTDPTTGERVNQEWAEATPAFGNDIWIVNQLVKDQGIAVGQAYTLTYAKD